MLAGCDSNSTGRDAAKAVGDPRVQYDFTNSNNGSEPARLAILYSKPIDDSAVDSAAASEKQISPV